MVDADDVWLPWFNSADVIHDALVLVRVCGKMSECVFHSAPILINVMQKRLVEVDMHYG